MAYLKQCPKCGQRFRLRKCFVKHYRKRHASAKDKNTTWQY